MLKITYYVFRQLSLTTLFLTIILTVAIWLTQSLQFVDGVLNKGVPISTFFYMVSFLLPELINVALPTTLMIAVIYTYNRLIADQEIVVMRSAGMSHWQLAKPALILATLITMFLYFLNLYAMPYAYSQIHDIKEGLQKTVSSKTLQPGEFNSFHGLTIYIRERTNSNDLKGILIHDNRNKKTPFIITAEAGTILKMPEGMRLVLINGARHEAEMTVEAPPTLYFDQYMVDTESPPSDSVRRKSPYERNLNDLLNPTVEIAEPKRHSRFRAYGHQRLLNPLQALAITLISLAFLLSGQINRRRRAKKIVIIVVCASMLQLLLLTYFNTGQIYWFAIPLAYATIFLSTLLPFAQINEWFNFSQPFKPAQSNEIESPRFQRDSSADDNAEKDPKQ